MLLLLHKSLSLKWTTHIPCSWHSITYARFLIRGYFQAVAPSCVGSFLCMSWIHEVRLCTEANVTLLCALLSLNFTRPCLVSDTEHITSSFIFFFFNFLPFYVYTWHISLLKKCIIFTEKYFIENVTVHIRDPKEMKNLQQIIICRYTE